MTNAYNRIQGRVADIQKTERNKQMKKIILHRDIGKNLSNKKKEKHMPERSTIKGREIIKHCTNGKWEGGLEV